MKTRSQLIYDHASRDLGLKETDGRASTPRIRQAIHMAASWLDEDDSVTPWCGCIRGLWAYETGTGSPPEHYRAKAWLNWGEKVKSLDDAITGDTIILSRDGGYHVCLLSGIVNSSQFMCLGGNQSNRVSLAKQLRSRIVGIRR